MHVVQSKDDTRSNDGSSRSCFVKRVSEENPSLTCCGLTDFVGNSLQAFKNTVVLCVLKYLEDRLGLSQEIQSQITTIRILMCAFWACRIATYYKEIRQRQDTKSMFLYISEHLNVLERECILYYLGLPLHSVSTSLRRSSRNL